MNVDIFLILTENIKIGKLEVSGQDIIEFPFQA